MLYTKFFAKTKPYFLGNHSKHLGLLCFVILLNFIHELKPNYTQLLNSTYRQFDVQGYLLIKLTYWDSMKCWKYFVLGLRNNFLWELTKFDCLCIFL